MRRLWRQWQQNRTHPRRDRPCSAQTCKRCNGAKYDPDAKGMDDRWCKECHGTGKAGPTDQCLGNGPQCGLPKLKEGDKIIVAVNAGKLTFKVNGEPRGVPIELPEKKVALAVSLKGNASVYLTSQSPLPCLHGKTVGDECEICDGTAECPRCKGDKEGVCVKSWKRRSECNWCWCDLIPCPDCQGLPVKSLILTQAALTPAVVSADSTEDESSLPESPVLPPGRRKTPSERWSAKIERGLTPSELSSMKRWMEGWKLRNAPPSESSSPDLSTMSSSELLYRTTFGRARGTAQ